MSPTSSARTAIISVGAFPASEGASATRAATPSTEASTSCIWCAFDRASGRCAGCPSARDSRPPSGRAVARSCRSSGGTCSAVTPGEGRSAGVPGDGRSAVRGLVQASAYVRRAAATSGSRLPRTGIRPWRGARSHRPRRCMSASRGSAPSGSRTVAQTCPWSRTESASSAGGAPGAGQAASATIACSAAATSAAPATRSVGRRASTTASAASVPSVAASTAAATAGNWAGPVSPLRRRAGLIAWPSRTRQLTVAAAAPVTRWTSSTCVRHPSRRARPPAPSSRRDRSAASAARCARNPSMRRPSASAARSAVTRSSSVRQPGSAVESVELSPELATSPARSAATAPSANIRTNRDMGTSFTMPPTCCRDRSRSCGRAPIPTSRPTPSPTPSPMHADAPTDPGIRDACTSARTFRRPAGDR